MYFLNLYLTIAIGTSILVGCFSVRTSVKKPLKIEPEEYTDWYKLNRFKLTDSIQSNNVCCVLQEVPVEYDLARMIIRNQLTKEDAKQAYMDENNNKSITYRLSVQLPEGTKDIYTFNLKSGEKDRGEYLAFGFKKHVNMVLNTGDTIACSNAIIERGISNHFKSVILLNFSLVERTSISSIVIDDRFWSDNQLVFDIQSFQTVHIPQLAL